MNRCDSVLRVTALERCRASSYIYCQRIWVCFFWYELFASLSVSESFLAKLFQGTTIYCLLIAVRVPELLHFLRMQERKKNAANVNPECQQANKNGRMSFNWHSNKELGVYLQERQAFSKMHSDFTSIKVKKIE